MSCLDLMCTLNFVPQSYALTFHKHVYMQCAYLNACFVLSFWAN